MTLAGGIACLAAIGGVGTIGFRAEIFGVAQSRRATRIEFRVQNDRDIAIDASELFAGAGKADRGSVAAVRLVTEPGGRILRVLRDAGGLCDCSRDLGPLLPHWHRDLYAEFPRVSAQTRSVVLLIPRLAPIRRRLDRRE